MDVKTRLQAIFDQYRNDCDYMEIRLEQSEETKIVMEKGVLKNLSSDFELGGNVRVLKDGGWAFVVFNDLDQLEKMAETAVCQVNLIGKSTSQFAPVKPVQDEIRYEHPGDPRKVSLSTKIEQLKKYCQIIDEYGEPIIRSRAKHWELFTTVTFANSEGTYIIQEKVDLCGSITVYASHSGETEYDMIGYGSIDDINVIFGLEDDVKKICESVCRLLDAPHLPGGQYTVILDPDMTGLFTHEAFGHLSEADAIAGNVAIEKTMELGRIFGSKGLNLYDAPLEGKRGTSKYDDEGVPCKKQYLIKDGKLVGRLHSRESAAKMGEQLTGNARATSYQHPPIVRMRSTTIEGGTHTFEEMLEGVDDGVYMVKARGGKTTSENFSFTSLYGYRIKDGQIQGLVKGVTLAGNVFSTLKNIDMIANDETVINFPWACGKGDQQGLAVSQGGPHIRIQNVTIGGEE